MLKIRENLKTDRCNQKLTGSYKRKKVHLDFKQMNNGQSWAFKKHIVKRERKFRNQSFSSLKRKRKFRNQNFLGLKRKCKFRNQNFFSLKRKLKFCDQNF